MESTKAGRAVTCGRSERASERRARGVYKRACVYLCARVMRVRRGRPVGCGRPPDHGPRKVKRKKK